MFKEFKEFAMRGNVVDMAVGIIIGAAFGTIVKSLVADIIMPPIGLLLGNVDFANLFILLNPGNTAGPYLALAEAQKAGAVTINYGAFINTIISFIIVAFAVFLLIRSLNRMKKHGGGPGGAGHQGVSLLPLHDPGQGHALRSLHLGIKGRLRCIIVEVKQTERLLFLTEPLAKCSRRL